MSKRDFEEEFEDINDEDFEEDDFEEEFDDFDEDIDFKINTKPGVLSDNKTIPKLDITAKEEITFDDDLTLAKLESIIRRCGILDEYKEYFTNDPDIVIHQYTLSIQKKYKYFNEFREGIMIAGDIVV